MDVVTDIAAISIENIAKSISGGVGFGEEGLDNMPARGPCQPQPFSDLWPKKKKGKHREL